MTREARAREAARLRANGLLVREIADRMGISKAYASALLLDPDGSKEKARKRRYDLVCVECGGRASGTDPARRATEPRCAECRTRLDRHWTPERIIEAIRATGEDSPSCRRVGSAARHAAVREFGSWRAAVEAAKLAPRERGSGGAA